ncbi:hypothetical protein ACWD26_25815 [Streptomyces sp. NPDC002787]
MDAVEAHGTGTGTGIRLGDAIEAQMRQPVGLVDAVRTLAELQVTTALELGPTVDAEVLQTLVNGDTAMLIVEWSMGSKDADGKPEHRPGATGVRAPWAQRRRSTRALRRSGPPRRTGGSPWASPDVQGVRPIHDAGVEPRCGVADR